MYELVEFKETPQLPEGWNYEESVAKVKQLIYKWRNITMELLNELWIARKILSAQGLRDKSPEVKTWSDYCEEIGSSRRVINRWLKRWEIAQTIKPKQLPRAKFAVIYADPPWQYEFSKSDSRAIESHYPTLSLQKICELPIPSDPDAILFLWATNPKIQEALQVMGAWGFEYRTNMVWVKDKMGMGYYVRGQHELLLIGRKGELAPPDEANRVSSIINAPRHEHSHKPEQVYEIIERMYPNQKYIELFATQKRDGWISWGK